MSLVYLEHEFKQCLLFLVHTAQAEKKIMESKLFIFPIIKNFKPKNRVKSYLRTGGIFLAHLM